ncbi:protein NDUFAF4 homolog [Uloborus diversus]|uniref:protein NDUFAF4 homolog n=1 Tax=Uloborus diversus TaxID=327109 RepID=UPI00240A149D|nr:protein NDUFAF4 homolog [Uloborus diversus]
MCTVWVFESKTSRPLPQMRNKPEIPLYGYEEPKVIPEGRCSLKQALEFISKHQNDPDTHSVKFIAEKYNMKESDVQNVLENFRAFEMHVSRDGKLKIADSEVTLLGARKIIQPLYKSKFSNMQLDAVVDSKDEKK